MKKNLKFCLPPTLLPILFAGQLSAQTDTILTAPEVEVTADRISKIHLASHVQVIDSQALARNSAASLADVLNREAGVFLKSYGAGSLATSALRGAGASHTAVVWNGFNLQNPMNGVADFALFPAWLADGVSVQHGGGSSLHGSGSVGGAVFLENKLALEQGLTGTASATAGSFGDWRQFGALGFSEKTWAGDLKIFHQQAQNDFPLPGGGGRRQENAGLRQLAVSQNNLLKIKENQTLKTFAWLQAAGRSIPPSRTEANARARQEDEVARFGAEWARVGQGSAAKVRAGWFGERLLYFSDVVDSSESRAQTFTAEAEQAIFFRKNTFRGGLHFTRQTASTRETGDHQRSRTAAFAAWQRSFFKEKLTWTADARQELADGKRVPLAASTGAEFRPAKPWALHARLARNFNLPTFNDLYWQDAFARGNPDLRPETGWGGEFGAHFQRVVKNRSRLDARLTAFSNRVENWILWSPQGSFWQPENKRTVWARGLETSLRMEATSGGWRFSTHLAGSLTRSTVEKLYDSEDPSLLGKQLPYVPLLNGSFSASAFFKNSSLTWRQQFTGKRFTTTDNSEVSALPGYSAAALAAGHSFFWKKNSLNLLLAAENLFNARYEVIAARPMPGRHWRIEMTVRI